jgi:hypothetical protein
MSDKIPQSGDNLRPTLRWARQHGCRIVQPPATGDIVVSHPLSRKRVRINGRRKDAQRRLTTFLRQLARDLGDDGPAAGGDHTG